MVGSPTMESSHRVLRFLSPTRLIALGVKDTTPHSDAVFLGDPSNHSAWAKEAVVLLLAPDTSGGGGQHTHICHYNTGDKRGWGAHICQYNTGEFYTVFPYPDYMAKVASWSPSALISSALR